MNKNTTVSVTLLLTFSLVVLTACSKQEENQAPQDSTAAPASVEPADTKSDMQTPDADSRNDEQQAVQTGEATLQDASSSETKSDEQKPATEQSVKTSGHEEQLALAQKSGCLACHAIDKKVVGPPWRDVSKRYLNDPNAKEKLIAKVSKGGRGNWTEVVGSAAMPPYSPRVSNENISKLVEFVLSLEK